MCIAAPGRRPAFAGPLPAVFRQRHYPPGLLKSREGGKLGRYSRHGRGVTEGRMLKTYEGGCHCGRVRFRIQVDLADTVIGECNCSICTKKGILHLPVAHERLEILSGADEMTTYTFGTGVAKHTFCRHCGIHAFYQPRSDPENYSVNARCLDEYDPATMQPRRLFDGQHWEQAFASGGREWEAKR
jgi:hypothetical protein